MGSASFDFLTESFLFRERLIDDCFAGVTESELLGELQSYRRHCLSRLPELIAEATRGASTFRLFAGVKDVPKALLKQSAFYVEKYILSDPIFPFSEQPTSYTKALRSYHGDENSNAINRVQLAKTIAATKELTSMVAADYVKLLPITYFFELEEEVPLFYSECQFSDGLPPEMFAFFRENVSLQLWRKEGNIISREPRTSLARTLTVEFGDESQGMAYDLFQSEIVGRNESEREIQLAMHIPNIPPSREQHEIWIEQSINQTAIRYHKNLQTDLSLAFRLGASYVSSSEFRSAFLRRFFPLIQRVEDRTSDVVMSLDLPFLDEIDVDTLMAVRRDYADSFQIFRIELERRLSGLRLVKDPEELKIKIDAAIHDLTNGQRELSMKLKQLRLSSLPNATLPFAVFVANFITGSSYLPTLVAGSFGALKTLIDYRSAQQQNPAFFLWKVKGRR